MYIHLKSVYWQVITEPGQVAWEHGFAFPKIESLKPEWRGTPMNYKFKLIVCVRVCVCVHAWAHVQVGKEVKLGGGKENALLPLSAQGKINQHRRLKNVKGFSHSPRFLRGLWMCLTIEGHLRSQQDAPGVYRAPLWISSSSSQGRWTFPLECPLSFLIFLEELF